MAHTAPSLSEISPKKADSRRGIGNVGGHRGEMKFMIECESRGLEAFKTDNDTGIDYVVYCPESKTHKNVQVTKGSLQNTKPSTYTISKPISRVREDVHIVAILIEHTQEGNNINTGKSGKQDMWFLVPFEVYRDDRMWENYNISTFKKSWNMNVAKRLKPPMDKALEAWYTLSRKNIKVSSFFE